MSTPYQHTTESVTDLTLAQITELFKGLLSHESSAVLAFANFWLVASEHERAEAYQAAQNMIYRYGLEPAFIKALPVAHQDFGMAAAVAEGCVGDHANAEERVAMRRCIQAAELLDALLRGGKRVIA